MNKHDRNNLDFIVSLSMEDLDAWFDTLSDDDVAYAMELIELAKTELTLQLLAAADEVEHTVDAAEVLKKFTLKGK